MRTRRLILMTAIAALVVVSLAGTALGVTATIGNDAIDRPNGPDSWSNFTIVDTNHPAPFDGTFSEVTFYAGRLGTINFVIVDESLLVTHVSADIPVTALGPQTVDLGLVGITAGSNLGYYTHGTGVIDYTLMDPTTAIDTLWEPLNAGKPAVGDLFNNVAGNYSNNDRVYSMNAVISATSPDICKDDGWMQYDYKNQGQCIASIVANEHADK